MSAVRDRDTKPELAVRRALHARGLRYRVHVGELPGKPDMVFPKWRVALFVHGCFWHRHAGCPRATTPASNVDYWLAKFKQNVERDRRNVEVLLEGNWRVCVVWECVIGRTLDESVADAIASYIRRGERSARHFIAFDRRRDVGRILRLADEKEAGVSRRGRVHGEHV